MSSSQASTWSLCHCQRHDTGVFTLVALAPLPSLPLWLWHPHGHCNGAVASVTRAVSPLWHWRCNPCCAGSLLGQDCPCNAVTGGGTLGGLAAIASCRYSLHVPPGHAIPEPLVLLSLLFVCPSSPCFTGLCRLIPLMRPPLGGPNARARVRCIPCRRTLTHAPARSPFRVAAHHVIFHSQIRRSRPLCG
jgi:hypothetical protein